MMATMRARWMLITMLASSLIATGCGTSEPPADVAEVPTEDRVTSPPANSRPTDGDHAWSGPDFTVTTFEGDRFTLSAQAGQPVVINFWESW